MIAVQQASQRPDLVDRLVLVSTVARYSHTRSIAEFDRLGGPEAGEVAARYYADPTELNFAEFMRVCASRSSPVRRCPRMRLRGSR